MVHIWEDENRFQKWLEIEVAICEAYAKLSLIPEADLNNIKTKARFDVQKILEIEKRTKHDVVAFIECVSEFVGPSAKYIHMGVTSSDILDTCFACQLNEASDILIADISALMSVLKEKALKYKNTPAIGRTHGIHAEPVTFGLKITHFYDEMRRNLERMKAARERIRHGKISGAVGTYAHVPPFVEEYPLRSFPETTTQSSSPPSLLSAHQ
jgi:adenylosuccinate lyase